MTHVSNNALLCLWFNLNVDDLHNKELIPSADLREEIHEANFKRACDFVRVDFIVTLVTARSVRTHLPECPNCAVLCDMALTDQRPKDENLD